MGAEKAVTSNRQPEGDFESQTHPAVLRLVPDQVKSPKSPSLLKRTLRMVLRSKGAEGMNRVREREIQRLESKPRAQNPVEFIEHIKPSPSRKLQFPSQTIQIVEQLNEWSRLDADSIMSALDNVLEEIISNEIRFSKNMSSAQKQRAIRKLVNSISATGNQGMERTQAALNEFISGAIPSGSVYEYALNLRNETIDIRKAKTYLYNQNKCISSFLNFCTESFSADKNLSLKTRITSPDELKKWSQELMDMWIDVGPVNSEKGIGNYLNTFKKFIESSYPEYLYFDYLVNELRKYLEIPNYNKLKVKLDNLLELDWQAHALCAQIDPESFFPEKGGSTRAAKQICQSCEVRAACLDYAMRNGERFGIWGGLSERERERLRTRGEYLDVEKESANSGSAYSVRTRQTTYLSRLHKLGEFLGLAENDNSELKSKSVQDQIEIALRDDSKVATKKAKTFQEVREVGEWFREGQTVLVDCSEATETERKRIIDFLSGLVFGQSGSIEKIASKIYLLTHPNVFASVKMDERKQSPEDKYGEDLDWLLRAIHLVITSRLATPSFISNELGISPSRARKLLMYMEAEGIVSAANERNERKVLVESNDIKTANLA